MTGTRLPDEPWTGPAFAAACGVTAGNVTALLTFPTGSGKTWLSLQAAREVTATGRRVIVVVPIRALAYEVESVYRTALPHLNVEAFTSDPRPGRRAKRLQDCAVIIVTPERLDLISRSWRRHHAWLAEVALIVADEIHHLADPQRGARYDAALTRMQLVLPLANVLALTATCGNPDDIARWIGGLHFSGGRRPVPQRWTLHHCWKPGDKPALLSSVLRPGHATQVFVHARKRTAELQAYLSRAGIRAAAYHAGLSAETRLAAETAYRNGDIEVLICTSAMESGVNLPTRDVVLYDVTLPLGDGRFERVSVNSAWQRAGRAGRAAGQDEAHIHVFECGREHAAPLLDGHFEPLISPLGRPAALLDFILGSIDGGYAQTRNGLERLTARTLAARQGHLDLREQLQTLLLQRALEEHEGRLSVTPLGRVASQSMLSPATVSAVLYLPKDAAVFDVFMRAGATPDAPAEPRLDPEGALWAEAALKRVSSMLLDAGDDAMISPVRALTALRACEVGDTEAAGELGIDVPSVTALRDTLIRVLTAWERWSPGHLTVRLARTMLAAQLPLDAATLALLPGIGRTRARQLAQAGVPHLEHLAQTPPADLVGPGVTLVQATRWVAAAGTTVDRWTTDPTREPPPRNRERWIGTRHTADPLRLRRAADLHVTPTDPANGTNDRYVVTGGSAPHLVTCTAGPTPRCDCLDWRADRPCKHTLAVLLYTGHAATLADLQRMRLDE